MTVITRKLVNHLQEQFSLNWKGIHGAPHWARVRENGLRLAPYTGAIPEIVELFAFIHDSKRLDDHSDPFHGKRSAEYATILRDSLIFLNDEEFKLLYTACELHSDGLLEGDVTILTCWDADRLDIGRVGIKPVADKLCTNAAKDPDFINWCYKRSIRGTIWDDDYESGKTV